MTMAEGFGTALDKLEGPPSQLPGSPAVTRREKELTNSLHGKIIDPGDVYVPGTDHRKSDAARWKQYRYLPNILLQFTHDRVV